MKKEYLLMLLIAGGTVFSLLLFVKKRDIRRAFFAAVTAQQVTWPIGIILNSIGKVEYPVRLFPKAVDSSFLHGYIMNPSIYAIYYIHYPRQARLVYKCMYTLLVTVIPALIEVLESKYTDLVAYKAWSGYKTWIMAFIIYNITRWYLDWFFQNAPKQGVVADET